uniref:ABC transporter permease n=1 Tax=candidate division WOR-3 bacterium TaxID=2052148 RepID=A0A7C4UFI1_UNCW3
MRKIKAIAFNTFKEGSRDRTLLSVSIAGIIILISSIVFIPISVGQGIRVVLNFGLSVIEILLLFQIIFVGTRIIYDELEKKTIYTIFSKPVKPLEVFAGKFLGLGLIIFIIETILFIFFFLFIRLIFGFFFFRIFHWYIFLLFELLLIESVVLFLSTFMSPITSGIISFLIYFIANTSHYIKEFSLKVHNLFFKIFANIVYYLFPNFSFTNIKNNIVYIIPFERELYLFLLSYPILYIILMLYLSSILFERKEFL